ncbi:MAG TPA: helix-turn-helix transcriptional regulator [Vicinamibacterales bacterium]|nr:helix-turn-helix transcriptional regulator [Vicinamibacterales bacterium]
MTTFSELWRKLRDKAYREQMVAEQAKRAIPYQVRALLTSRGYSQKELAARAGLHQGAVSRAADLDYGNLTLNTIVRLAAGFDVAFVGEFVPFSRFVDYMNRLPTLGQVATFEDEDRSRRGETVAASQTMEAFGRHGVPSIRSTGTPIRMAKMRNDDSGRALAITIDDSDQRRSR